MANVISRNVVSTKNESPAADPQQAPVVEENAVVSENAPDTKPTQLKTESPTPTPVSAPAPTSTSKEPVIDFVTATANDALAEYKMLASLRTPTDAQLKSMATMLSRVVGYGINPKKDSFHETVMQNLYSFIKDNRSSITDDNHLYRGFNLLGDNQSDSGMLAGRVLRMLANYASNKTNYEWHGLKSSVTPSIYNKLRLLVKAK